eukprot:1046084-Prymnesium_polylepis.1
MTIDPAATQRSLRRDVLRRDRPPSGIAALTGFEWFIIVSVLLSVISAVALFYCFAPAALSAASGQLSAGVSTGAACGPDQVVNVAIHGAPQTAHVSFGMQLLSEPYRLLGSVLAVGILLLVHGPA